MRDFFYVIKKYGEGIYKEKGSKFLAFAYSLDKESDIDIHLESLRKKYYDARHHCYAWVFGQNYEKYRSNDDGEPSHSAGDPILGQIRSRDLTNTLVVVVRYFGGTKLGVGGLINAFKSSASEALDTAGFEKKTINSDFKLIYRYDQTTMVMRFIHEEHLSVSSQVFEDHCSLIVSSVRSRKQRVEASLINLIERGHLISFESL